jgi:hypothetical protein
MQNLIIILAVAQFEKLEYTEEDYEKELECIEKVGNFIRLLTVASFLCKHVLILRYLV